MVIWDKVSYSMPQNSIHNENCTIIYYILYNII